MLRRLLLVAWISGLSVLGCSSEDAADGTAGGTGGNRETSTAGTGDSSGAAGAGGDSCAGRGGGTIEVRIAGLPDGVEASLIVGGPNGSQAVTSDQGRRPGLLTQMQSSWSVRNQSGPPVPGWPLRR